MLLITIPLSSLRRAPLAIVEEKPAADSSSGQERERETLEVKVADPPSEPAKAAVEAEKDTVTPSEAPPLVVDLQSRDTDAGDAATTNAFEVVPRAGAGGEDGSFPLPSSVAVETAKDSAMTVAISSLPGPHLATLEDTPPYSGPAPGGLDAS